jgi:glyoxylase-like metal-dependent hydrolase (beta-lactamase superfamily II)
MFAKLLAVSALATTAVHAQYQQSNNKPEQNPLSARLIKTGLYMISGGGCNSLLRLTAHGLIVVDGGLPENYTALRAKVRKISDQPVRILIDTGYGDVHTANNDRFAAGGTQIIAQENVKAKLATPPSITYGSEYKIQMGGIEALLYHFGNARTNGDTVVYFPNLKVVALGDLLAPSADPDVAGGGSLAEWSAVLGRILQLDFDTAVPSSGEPVKRADVDAFKTRLDGLARRAATPPSQPPAE